MVQALPAWGVHGSRATVREPARKHVVLQVDEMRLDVVVGNVESGADSDTRQNKLHSCLGNLASGCMCGASRVVTLIPAPVSGCGPWSGAHLKSMPACGALRRSPDFTSQRPSPIFAPQVLSLSLSLSTKAVSKQPSPPAMPPVRQEPVAVAISCQADLVRSATRPCPRRRPRRRARPRNPSTATSAPRATPA